MPSLSIDGIVSGLDTTGIITELLALERRPLTLIQGQAELTRRKQTAFLELSARLLSVQTAAAKLSRLDTFRSVTASSSRSEELAVSASAGVPPGSYSFRVAQLARGSQYLSTGFAAASTPVGAGTLTLELGGGSVAQATELEVLNGGAGVRRGSFRITDAAGNTAVIDVSAAITVADVIERINDTTGVQVTASVAGNAHAGTGRAIVLEDTSGGGGTLTVQELSGGRTAQDLGILGSAVGSTLEGSAVRTIGRSTRLSELGDGLGLRGGAGDDIRFTLTDGTTFSIDVGALNTVGDLLDAVHDHADNAGKLTLSINSDGDGFVALDGAGGGGSLTIEDADPLLGTAATDLGLVGSSGAGSITGARRLAGIDDTLLATLNGGAGVVAGSIEIQDRSGATAIVDLTTAHTLQDVIRAIQDAAVGVTASVDSTGNGLLLRDTSGGSGALAVSEVGGGTTGAELGLTGSVQDDELDGSGLAPRYLHANTLLADLNGGRGVAAGRVRITDAEGIVFTVNLNGTTIGEVIRDLQGAASVAGSSLTVEVNDEGNGLLLESPVGAGTLRVEDLNGGTVARDLHIAGNASTATPNRIDGAFARTITIGATDTLQDVLDAIDELGLDVTASLVQDGSSAPYRLNLVSSQSGQRARLRVETSGGTALDFQRTAEARDGVIFYGDAGRDSQPVLIRSRTNTYTDIVGGLTVTAQEVSETPVRVTVSRDLEAVQNAVGDLVNRLNDVFDSVATLTAFDTETNQAGLLIGDGTLRTLKNSLIQSLARPLQGEGNTYSLARELGLRVQNDRVTFDASALQEALETNPTAVQQFFAASRTLADTVLLEDFNNGNGVHDAAGADLEIHLRDGSSIELDVAGLTTVEQLLAAINSAGGGNVTASLSTAQNAIVLTDATSGNETFRVTSLNESRAFNDLGLNRSADTEGGGTLTGFAIDLNRDPGIAARLVDSIETLVSAESGAIQARSDAFDSILGELEKRIERAEERLSRREEVLRRQFAQLEQIMQSSQATLQRLTASLTSISGSR